MTQRRPTSAEAESGVASIVDTTEIRWFASGPLPPEIWSWFSSPHGVVERRRDTYLVDDRAHEGIKHRGGTLLEVKARWSVGPSIELGPHHAGRLEVWRKWTPADGLVDLPHSGHWVDVDKLVMKRRFSEDGTEIAFSKDQAEGSGCDVEIAAVTVDGHHAFTFAFAAFGPPGRRPAAIATAWRTLTSGGDAPIGEPSTAWSAMSYPEWLATTIPVDTGDPIRRLSDTRRRPEATPEPKRANP